MHACHSAALRVRSFPVLSCPQSHCQGSSMPGWLLQHPGLHGLPGSRGRRAAPAGWSRCKQQSPRHAGLASFRPLAPWVARLAGRRRGAPAGWSRRKQQSPRHAGLASVSPPGLHGSPGSRAGAAARLRVGGAAQMPGPKAGLASFSARGSLAARSSRAAPVGWSRRCRHGSRRRRRPGPGGARPAAG